MKKLTAFFILPVILIKQTDSFQLHKQLPYFNFCKNRWCIASENEYIEIGLDGTGKYYENYDKEYSIRIKYIDNQYRIIKIR